VKKPQWITIGSAALLVTVIFIFGKTVPSKKIVASANNQQGDKMPDVPAGISTDTILAMAKKQLRPEQIVRLNTLEHSISRGDVKDQQIRVYHQLARFWSDSANIFAPFAWYEAEAARLENSEKSLTFAARLFLDNLQKDDDEQQKQWKALQAKDLFERSLKINPDNDSSKVGLGACYLFGDISAAPMVGITKIREVVEKDSSNIYAQMMLIQGLLLSGQYDKAISRLQLVNRMEPDNVEAIFLLADTYDRTNDKANAIVWYNKSLAYVKRSDARAEVEKRIKELSK
jgi:tetratricopeptide (TPR) repeat protein